MVYGAGFVSGSVVNWNGSALGTTYVSVDQLTAVVPAANIASPGTASISVINPPPGGGTSNFVSFEITSPVNPTFAATPSTLPAAAVMVADFNGDGKPDLAANTGVMLGNGDGTFQALLAFPSGFSGTLILAGDFNGDGILDLATSSGVMLGNGDGTFQAPLAYPSGIPTTGFLGGPLSVLAGDFNRDGKLDLIYAEAAAFGMYSGNVYVLLGNGDGTFAAPLSSGSGGDTPPGSQAIGDFNGDGNLDLAIGYPCCTTEGNVTIYYGNGDGTFQIPGQTFDTLSFPDAMVAAAFKADGVLDIAIGSGALNSGIEFVVGPEVINPPVSTPVYTLVAADLTGDGMLDLIDNGYVLLNNGDGTFSPLPSTNAGQLFGDFNGDGRMDYVSGNQVFLQSPAISGLPNSGLSFGNQVVGTPSTPQTVQVQNTGSAVLAFTSIQASADFTESDNCRPSVAVGASCTISVTFDPPAEGPLTGTLTLTDNAGDSPETVQLSGTGIVLTPPTISPSLSLEFGNIPVGTTSTLPVTVTNTSTMALGIAGVSIGPTPLFTQSNNCPASVAPGGSCTINVSFSPTPSYNENQILSGWLSIADYASGSPQTLLVQGSGIMFPPVISPASLSFSGQLYGTTSASQPVTVKNTNAVAQGIAVQISSNWTQSNNCLPTIAPNSSCTVNVSFLPTADGALTGVLTISYGNGNEGGTTSQTVTLSGTGLGVSAGLSPSSLTFSSQQAGTTSAPQTVTLQNSGNQTLSITSMAVTGANSTDFALTSTCGTSVNAGASCTINVTFAPTAAGTRNATVSIVDNAANSPQAVSLTGTATAPTASLSPGSLTFPGQFVDTTGLPQNITLTNNGDAPLTLSGVQASTQFGSTNGCTSTLAAGVSCTISVFFDPTSAGAQTGTLTLTDNAAGSPQTIPLSGAGMDFTVSSSSTSATVAAGQTATYALTVAPLGGLNQTVSLACSGAPSLSTCTVTPGSAALNGSASVPVTVSVSTTAGTLAPPMGNVGTRHGVPPLGGFGGLLWPYALLMLASLAALAGARKRPAAYLLGLSLVMIMLWGACGGGGQVVHTPGTPSGTYALSVTATVTSNATSTQLTHSLSLTLNVN
jgi:hypothetical protein